MVANDIKRLERREAEIKAEKELLLNKLREEEEERQWLKDTAKAGEYSSPKEMAETIFRLFNIAPSVKRSSRKTTRTGRRTRTRVTPELRDEIKAQIAGGKSKNQISKERGISYMVISKIEKGHYDKKK